MKVRSIFTFFLFIIKIYCSGHNHQALQVALTILAASDINYECLTHNNCGPKLDENGNLLKINIGKTVYFDANNNSNRENVEATIFDIIPALRTLPRDIAMKYFKNILFPAAKDLYDFKFRNENVDDYKVNKDLLNYLIERFSLFDSKIDIFLNSIKDTGNYAEVNKVLLGVIESISSEDDNYGYFNNFKYYFSTNNIDENSVSRDIAFSYLNNYEYGLFNINSNLIKGIIDTCKGDTTGCKDRYFKDYKLHLDDIELSRASSEREKFAENKKKVNSKAKQALKDGVNFMIVATGVGNERRYHFIVKDIKNGRLARPFSLKEEYNTDTLKTEYVKDTAIPSTELYFYKLLNLPNLAINDDLYNNINTFIKDAFSNSKYNLKDSFDKIKNGKKNIKQDNDRYTLSGSGQNEQKEVDERFNKLENIKRADNKVKLFESDLAQNLMNEISKVDSSVTYQQCQRFAKYLFNDIYKYENNYDMTIIDNTVLNKMNEYLTNQRNEFSIRQRDMLPNLRYDNSLSVESISNFYNKENHNPKGKGEEGYAKDEGIDILYKSNILYKGTQLENVLSIPQLDNIDQYPSYIYDTNMNYLNGNIVMSSMAKAFENEELYKYITNPIANKELLTQLRALDNYISRKSTNPDQWIDMERNKVNIKDRWINSFLESNLNRIKDNIQELNDNINELLRIKGSNTGNFEIRNSNDVTSFNRLLDNFVFKEKEILLNILEDIKKDIRSMSNPRVNDKKNYLKLQDMIEKLNNNNGFEKFTKQEKDMLIKLLKSKFYERRSDRIVTNTGGITKVDHIPYYKVKSDYIDKILKDFLGYDSSSGKIQSVEDISNQIDRIINNNRNYINNIEMMKNDFENRNHGIKFNDDFLTSYINYNVINDVEVSLINFSDIINKFTSKNDDYVKTIVQQLSIPSDFEHFYAVSIDGEVFSIGLEGNHIEEAKEMMKVTSENNGELCYMNRMKRAGESNSCLRSVNFGKIFDIGSYTLDSLSLFKELSSDILLKNIGNLENINSIESIKKLYKNAESIDDIWNQLTNIYEDNIGKIDEETSVNFIKNLYYTINEYKELLSNSQYNESKYIDNVDEKTVKKMEECFYKVYNIYKEKNNYEKILENDEEIKISDYKYDIESKLGKNELINIIRILVNIVNEKDINSNSLGVMHINDKVLSVIDYKTIMPGSKDIVDAIEQLLRKFNDEKFLISEDDERILGEIYFKLSLYSIYNNDDGIMNRDLIDYLSNSIGQKLGEINNKNEVKNSLRSDNVSLKVPEIERFEKLEDKNILDVIKDESISIENKLYVIKGLASDINNLDEKRLTKEHLDSMHKIYEYINSKANQIKNYESFEGREQEVNGFNTLTEYYNDLVTFIYDKYGEEYSGTINKINIGKELNDEIAEKNNLLNKISVIQYYHTNLNNLKYKLYNDDLDSLSYNDFRVELENLEQKIYEGIEEFLKIENPIHHYNEAVKLVELLNNQNELVAEYINNINRENIIEMYGKIDPYYIYNNNELTGKLKYLISEKYIKALSNILENNKEKFNINKNSDVETLISNAIKNLDKEFKFSEGYELPEINIDALNKILNKNFNSESEVIDYMISCVSDNNQLADLKECYDLKRKLIEHEAPTTRNENEVETIIKISEKLGLSINDNQLKTFQKIVYDSFIEFLEASSKFDEYVKFENLKNDDNGNLDISDIYINSKGRKVITNNISKLFGKLNIYVTSLVRDKGLGKVSDEEFNELKDNIEISVGKLKDFITMYVNELSKSVDKENDKTFNNAYNYLENIVNSANSFITSATNLCGNEYIKDDVSEALDKLNELKTLNNKYKKETNNISVKAVTISVPKYNTERNNSDEIESYDQMNLEEKILKALKKLKAYDSKNIKVKNDETRIQNPGNLYTGTNTLIDMIKKLLETYSNNINNINDSKESRDILSNLYDAINVLVNRYAKSEFLEDANIRFLNEELVRDLSSSFEKSLLLHNAKFNEKLKDNNGNEIKSIIDYKSIAETKSKYVNDILRDIYNKLFNIFDTDEFNKGLRDNMELDSNNKVNKVYDDDRATELKFLIKKIGKYEINSNDKEYQREELLSIYKQLSELEEIFDRENNSIVKNNGNDFTNNSEAVYSLSNSLYNTLKNNFDDEEIQNLRKNYNSKIGNSNKSDIKTENVLNLDYLIKNTENNSIIKDPNYRSYVNNYFTYLKHRLLDSLDNENDKEKIMTKIETVNNDINEKINQFCSYDSPDGHYEEADHIIELSNNLNELISFCIDNDIELDDIEPINLSGDGELSNRLNYVRVKLMIDTFDEIAKAHPDIFKLESDKSLSDYIESNGGSAYYSFGSYYIREPVERDLQSIIKDIVESKHDAIVTFVDNATNEYQVMQLERSFGMKYKLIIHESSFYRIKDEVDDMNKILKNKNFINHLKNKCFKRLETYDQTRKRLDTTLVNLAKLTDVDINDTDTETIVSKAKELALSTNNKKLKNKIVNHLNNYVDFHKNEIIKISGKVSSDVFKTIYDHSLAFNKVSMDAINAIEFKSSNSYDSNKLEKAMNYNNKFNENINHNIVHNELPNSSSIKQHINNNGGHHNTGNIGGSTTPGHNHKPKTNPGKIKRNIYYHKVLY